MTDHTTHFDDCGCKTAALNDAARINAELRRDLTAARDNSSNMAVEVGALRAERDALRLRVAALEAAILRWRKTHPWNTRSADIAARDAEDELWATTADVTTALRAMLVEALVDYMATVEFRERGKLHPGQMPGWRVEAEAFIDNRLGASKEGGE